MLINENDVRERFVSCLNEVSINTTLKEIAIKSGTSKSYLSQLKTKSRQIPVSMIANFCLAYGYSPTWILTGKGPKKLIIKKDKEERLIDHNEQLLQTIRDLLRALIELKPVWDNAAKELVEQARKRSQ